MNIVNNNDEKNVDIKIEKKECKKNSKKKCNKCKIIIKKCLEKYINVKNVKYYIVKIVFII